MGRAAISPGHKNKKCSPVPGPRVHTRLPQLSGAAVRLGHVLCSSSLPSIAQHLPKTDWHRHPRFLRKNRIWPGVIQTTHCV